MTVSKVYVDWLTDALSPVGQVSVKRMFGGAGVYCDGAIFALIDCDQLYLKTDEAGQAAFLAEGLAPFTYSTKHGPSQLKTYWQAPERLADDTDELLAWAGRSIAVARRAPVTATPEPSGRRPIKTAPAKSSNKTRSENKR